MGQDINDQVVGKNWKMINLLGDEVENLKFLIFIKIRKFMFMEKRSKKWKKDGSYHISNLVVFSKIKWYILIDFIDKI